MTIPPLWTHQAKEFNEHRDDRSRALLWSMRTGKTRACIDLAMYLWKHGRIEAVIILAPNGVHENWILRELPKYVSQATTQALAWSYPERNKPDFQAKLENLVSDAQSASLPWLSVNNESIQYDDTRKAIGRFIHKDRKRKRPFLLICDESSDFGRPGTNRTQFAIALSTRASYVRILDGTVVEDSPLKAFSQYQILQKGALGFRTAQEFNNRYAVYEKSYKRLRGRQFSYPKLTGYQNLDELRSRMAKWSSVVLREDCHDMPPLLHIERAYRPSPEQLEAYEAMRLAFSANVGDGEVTAEEAAVRLIKLQQILSGYIVDDEGVVRDIPGRNPRLDVLSNEVMLSQGKTIVWCRFRPDVLRVSQQMQKEGVACVRYMGGISAADKNSAVNCFQNDPKINVFVGTPVRGLELSAADTVIWYSHTFHTLMRSQADERATKMGGSATDVIDLLAETPDGAGVDRYILDNQARKRSVSEDLARGGLKRVLESVNL